MAALQSRLCDAAFWRLMTLSTALLALSACSDDTPEKVARQAPKAATSSDAPSAASVVVASEQHSSRGDDVMKWLQMSPDKKAEAPKPDAASAAKATATAPAPVVEPPRTLIAQRSEAPPPIATPPVAAAATGGGSTGNAPVLVASAAPAASAGTLPSAAGAANALKLISKEQPTFPVEAARQGVTSGRVRAMLYVNKDGSVAKVEVMESQPRRVFDKSVVAAALRWKYSPVAEPQTVIAEFDFKAEE